jgi:hypothetical protein
MLWLGVRCGIKIRTISGAKPLVAQICKYAETAVNQACNAWKYNFEWGAMTDDCANRTFSLLPFPRGSA